MTKPTYVNAYVHAPEGSKFKASLRPSVSDAGWVFDLAIGSFSDCIHIRGTDIRRFVNTMQAAFDHFRVLHGEAEEEALTSTKPVNDGKVDHGW